MRRRATIIGLAVALTLSACSSATAPRGAGDGAPSSAPASTHPATRSTSSRPSSSVPSASSAPSGRALPRGGTRILGHYRVVAYYGAAGNPQLGVLGATDPETAARKVTARAAGFAAYHEPVQPAMELITTVAQGGPGPDGSYSKYIGDATVRRYLAVAHAHRMLLILDLQPGRASFLAQAERVRPFLLDPSVQLGLDPEWKVGPGQRPGDGRIGSSRAAGINDVGAWLSDLVRDHHLPDKLMIVHEFTSSMLPDRQNLTQHAGVESVLHADGFGTVASKIGVLHKLAFPDPPFGTGFKLFLTQDQRLMSPAEVMALRPRPDVITYQ